MSSALVLPLSFLTLFQNYIEGPTALVTQASTYTLGTLVNLAHKWNDSTQSVWTFQCTYVQYTGLEGIF